MAPHPRERAAPRIVRTARITRAMALLGTPLIPERYRDNPEAYRIKLREKADEASSTALTKTGGGRGAARARKPWHEEVVDEQGRRRFHGAFTGGFSAGYYNTVGSKEGWKPSQFTSSRGDRARRRRGGAGGGGAG